MDTKFLQARNRMGAKRMSMRFRSTMDYSPSLRPARGAIKFRWDIVGDGHLEFNFEHRRANLGWTASHHWDLCPEDSELPPRPLTLVATPKGRARSQEPGGHRHDQTRPTPGTASGTQEAWAHLAQPPAVPTVGAVQGAQEALQLKKQKPGWSRGCLLNCDLEKGDIRARPPVKIDESRNEERDPGTSTWNRGSA